MTPYNLKRKLARRDNMVRSLKDEVKLCNNKLKDKAETIKLLEDRITTSKSESKEMMHKLFTE